MMTTYKISSRNDARLSRLDGEEYETLEAALADCRRVGPSDLVEVEVDAGNESAWWLYAYQEDADADRDGARPHLAIASIETVTKRRGDVVAELSARQYEDHDDCLAAAVADEAERLGLETWQLSADWDDQDERNAIVVRVA